MAFPQGVLDTRSQSLYIFYNQPFYSLNNRLFFQIITLRLVVRKKKCNFARF